MGPMNSAQCTNSKICLPHSTWTVFLLFIRKKKKKKFLNALIITWSMKPQLNWCTQPLIGAHSHHFDTTPTKSMQTQLQNAINLCSLGNNHKIASCKPSHPRTLLMTALTTKFVCVSMCNKREGRGFLSAKRERNEMIFMFWKIFY